MGHLDLGPSSAKEGPEDASPGAASASTVSALLRWCHSHPPCLWLCGHCNSIFTDPEGGREGGKTGVQAVGAVIWDGEAGLCFTWNIYLFLGGEIGLLDKH